MNKRYQAYIGGYENAIGRYAYVKFPQGYVGGKVIEWVAPKHGIVGTYKVQRDDGKIMSAKTIYIEWRSEI